MAPGCAVVVLSPFGALRNAALEAGAYDLVDPCDLRDLERCLDRLMRETPTDGSSPTDNSEPGSSPVLGRTPTPIKVWHSTTPTYYQLASPGAQQKIDGGNIQVKP